MKKIALVVFAVVLTIGFSLTISEAAEWCWKMDPYIDIVKVTVTKPDPLKPHKLAVGRWYDATNTFPVVGAVEKSVDGLSLIISLHGTKDNMSKWDLRAVLDPVTKAGTWQISNSTETQSNSGTFTRVNCLSLTPLSISDGPSATDVK
jgi:hypothetical protein